MAIGSTAQAVMRLWLQFSNARHFDDATWEPQKAQREKLLTIIRRNERTEYGKQHDFTGITNLASYQKRVPVNGYDDLAPWLDRVVAGEKNVLTADDPLMFATTSGTTGSAKYIPVTPSYLHEYGHGLHTHTYRVFADFRDILDGRALVSSSNDQEGFTEGGLPFGAISGYLSRSQPSFVKRFYVLPSDLARVKQVEHKYYQTLLFGLAADVRYMVTPNPSSLLLLAERMNNWSEELIHDIRVGGVNERFRPENAPKALRDGVSPNPQRAEMLASALRRNGSLKPADAWPNLRLISCWKGGTMPLYLKRLPAVYGDVPTRDLGYMASEGRGATPLVNSGSGGVLNITSHFFEFVKEEDRDNPNATFIGVEDLEADQEYFIFFTTSAGLYRYDINDVVRVVDFYRNTPVIQFVRKGQGVSSITGEKLTESQVTAALVDVCEKDQFEVQHFTACVEWGEPPRYQFFVEGGPSLTTERAADFAAKMDQHLSVGNIEYEAKRHSGRLEAPVVKRVAPGTYNEIRQKRVLAGAGEAQVKIPHLSPKLTFGDDLTVIEEIPARKEQH